MVRQRAKDLSELPPPPGWSWRNDDNIFEPERPNQLPLDSLHYDECNIIIEVEPTDFLPEPETDINRGAYLDAVEVQKPKWQFIYRNPYCDEDPPPPHEKPPELGYIEQPMIFAPEVEGAIYVVLRNHRYYYRDSDYRCPPFNIDSSAITRPEDAGGDYGQQEFHASIANVDYQFPRDPSITGIVYIYITIKIFVSINTTYPSGQGMRFFSDTLVGSVTYKYVKVGDSAGYVESVTQEGRIDLNYVPDPFIYIFPNYEAYIGYVPLAGQFQNDKWHKNFNENNYSTKWMESGAGSRSSVYVPGASFSSPVRSWERGDSRLGAHLNVAGVTREDGSEFGGLVWYATISTVEDIINRWEHTPVSHPILRPPIPPRKNPPPCCMCCQNDNNDRLLRLILKRIGEPTGVFIYDENPGKKGSQTAERKPRTLFAAAKLATERVELNSRITGIASFPVEVPDTVIQPYKDGVFGKVFDFIDGDKVRKLNSVAEFIAWQAEQDSATTGQFHQLIEIDTKEGTQKILIPSIADALREMILLLTQLARNSAINLDADFRTLIETADIKTLVSKALATVQDIQDYLDYPTREVTANVPVAVNIPSPDKTKGWTEEHESYESLMRNSYEQIVYHDWTGEQSHQDMLNDILHVMSMLKAIIHQRTDVG